MHSHAPSPPLIRNRACPISALSAGRSRIDPTSAGEPERGKPHARPFVWLPPPHPPPQAAGLSGEDLGIFERQLIDGELGVWLAWVDWRRLADPSDRRSGEQTLPDELGEAQVQHP